MEIEILKLIKMKRENWGHSMKQSERVSVWYVHMNLYLYFRLLAERPFSATYEWLLWEATDIGSP